MIRYAHHGKLKYLLAKNASIHEGLKPNQAKWDTGLPLNASIYEVLKPNQAEWDTGFPFRPET